MENYLKLSEKIQGASFDRLLDEFGNQIFDLLKTAKIQSTLSDDKALAMATVRDWMNIKMSCPSEVENEDSIGCKKKPGENGRSRRYLSWKSTFLLHQDSDHLR